MSSPPPRPATDIALVTGGARRIGRAIAEKLAEAGYSVVIHCNRSRAEAEELRISLTRRGGKVHVLAADLADAGAAARLVPQAAEFGPLSLLVNSAAIFDDVDAPVFDPARFDRHMAINLRAPLILAHAFADQARKGSGASIVNILDQRVLKPDPRCLSYALSKAALQDATVMLAQAFAPKLRVNAVAPGPTAPNARDGEEGVSREAAATPLKLRVSPEAIAEAVLFLARAPHVTGATLPVDSGQHVAWRTPDVLATLKRE